MKTAITFLALTVIFFIAMIIMTVKVNYRYSNEIGSYWELSDKSSTILKKSEYIDQFVDRLSQQGFEGMHNAIIFKTPDNSFDQNFIALKTFQDRLHEISDMDIQSFEYQTAIQQITGQEQGEANEMINTFKGIYKLINMPLTWDWIAILIWTVLTLSLLTLPFVILTIYSDF